MNLFPAIPRSRSRLLRLALAAVAVGLAAACSLPEAQPDLTRYYVLTTPTKAPAPSTVTPHWRVALRSVDVPSFLRARSLQVRVADNEIVYADEARWAESLEAGVGRVLRESLEGKGEISRVVEALGADHDFNLTVGVLRCEGDRQKGVARFSALITIDSTGPGGGRRAREVFTTEIPGWDKQSYGQLAAKLSEAVDALGDRIAALLATGDKQ